MDVSDADQITEKTLPRTVASARALAVQTGAVVAVSGPIDVLTDGRETILLHNGCATMSRVTGSGCMLTALMGAFCGAMPGQPFAAACAAAATMGVAGELAEARRNGYAFDSEELEAGLCCYAAPIFDYTNYPTAAISVSGPCFRMEGSLRSEIIPALQRSAQQITDLLVQSHYISSRNAG